MRSGVAGFSLDIPKSLPTAWMAGSRVLGKLDELKLAEKTIVLYFSDNGPNTWRWNGGMKGRKGSTDEGGVRSPLGIAAKAATDWFAEHLVEPYRQREALRQPTGAAS